MVCASSRVDSSLNRRDRRQIARWTPRIGRIGLLEATTCGLTGGGSWSLAFCLDMELFTITIRYVLRMDLGGDLRISSVGAGGSRRVRALMFKSAAVTTSRFFEIASRFF